MKTQAFLLAAALSGAAFAQQQTTTTAIDGQKMTVQYAPPAAGKRMAASFQAEADVAFKGVRAPKGSYTLYVISDSPEWQLAVNKATGAKAAAYDPKLDLGRVKLTMGAGAAGPGCKMALSKVAALAAKLEIACNGKIASANFHLDRGGANSEW